jgi:hypothetical protein
MVILLCSLSPFISPSTFMYYIVLLTLTFCLPLSLSLAPPMYFVDLLLQSLSPYPSFYINVLFCLAVLLTFSLCLVLHQCITLSCCRSHFLPVCLSFSIFSYSYSHSHFLLLPPSQSCLPVALTFSLSHFLSPLPSMYFYSSLLTNFLPILASLFMYVCYFVYSYSPFLSPFPSMYLLCLPVTITLSFAFLAVTLTIFLFLFLHLCNNWS